MFNSIKVKLTTLLVLFVLATELVVGVSGVIGVIHNYHKSFENDMVSVFSADFRNELDAAAALDSTAVSQSDTNGGLLIEESEGYASLRDKLNNYLGALSIGGGRFYAILDGATGSVLTTSSNAREISSSSRSILAAMDGSTHIESGTFAPVLEYALPVMANGKVKNIIYVMDNCAAQHDAVSRMLHTLFVMLIISLVAAIIAGAVVSVSISEPLKQLTKKAKKLAAGDSSDLTESSSRDELGMLNNSLVQLAHSRNEINEKAKGEQIKVETILQNMTDGILAFNPQGKLIHYNPVAKKLLHRNYLDDVQFDSFFHEIQVDITLGDLMYIENENLERDAHIGKQLLNFDFAVFTTDNKVGGIIVIIHDITKQEKLEASRRNFVADVSHELRTPLTTIKSYSETLSDMPDIDRELQVRFLNVIASEADRMARIISDLLILSELDGDKNTFRSVEDINVRDMVSSVVERMDISAKKRSQTLTYSPVNEIPVIRGHRDSLERVIINIISNAIKYTPSGGKIDVYTSKVYNDICIKVVDNGIGIAEDKLPHIFDRFYRVDKARSRDTGGTGLGLAIAKQTLESGFNGKIIINSELNKGTEVIITIPITE